MITRREQADASRDALITAAVDVFAGGYESATVAEILSRVDMAKGALYHYFPGGKQEIFAAAVDRLDAAWHADFEHRPERSGVERIVAAAAAFLRHCQDPAFRQIVLIDAPAQFPEQWTGSIEYRLLRGEVDDLAAHGQLGVDPVAATDALFGAIERSGIAVGVAESPVDAAQAALDVITALVRAIARTS